MTKKCANKKEAGAEGREKRRIFFSQLPITHYQLPITNYPFL